MAGTGITKMAKLIANFGCTIKSVVGLRLNVGMLAIVAGILFSCAESVPHPTKTSTMPGCYVACPQGYTVFRHQHLCRGGIRQFQDVTITGEDNVPGSPSDDRWYTLNGAYLKIDVETVTCHAYIDRLIRDRDPRERGQFPGEDEQGNPTGHETGHE
jgi:hypothetical protein